jgi:DNA-binding SARP family transcriptional activator/predicted ATPase
MYGDEPVTAVNSARLQSLLAYLVLHRAAPQSRQHLAFRFWPDSTEAQARNNLRQALHQLRHALPDADRFLSADTTTLCWQSDAAFSLDVSDFAHALATADAAERSADPAAMRAALEQAVSLYRGDLLPSCYDEWISAERDRLCEQQLKALERLVRILEEQREYATAIPYAQHRLRHDPLDEDSYLRLMRLHTLNNDRASALRVYHVCASTLQRELGVEPSPATRDAYERLLRIDAAPTARRPALTAASPLIGRQAEWEQLQGAWRRAAGGQAHFALITGEAGIGKSRLAEELLAWVGQQGFTAARTRAYAAEGQLSYGPVTEWLRSEPLRAAYARLDTVWLTEVARLLPELLAEHPDLPHPEPLAEFWQRRRLFEALAHVVLQASQPLLLLIDDLHWCDQETLEWLHYLLRFEPRAQLLVVGTARAEEAGPQHPLMTLLHDLRSAGDVTEMALEPLDAAETARLATSIAGRELDTGQALHLYRETEGNPLFVVETVRVEVDRRFEIGDSKLESQRQFQSLPPRVHAVIAARLAQLTAPARDLASLAATIGRAFTFDILAQASAYDEDRLVRALDELWQRRIVREQGVNAYDFSHDKIREVAYAEVRPAQRRLLHRRIARTLESAYAADLDPVSAHLAAHYEQADMFPQAIAFYQRAAEVARRVYANHVAIACLEKGLTLLKNPPNTPERMERELDMLVELASAFMDTKGWASPEAEQAYTRALALCQQVEKLSQLFRVLWGLHQIYMVQAKQDQARAMAEQCLHLAQRTQDPALLLQAHHALSGILFLLSPNELLLALEHAEQGIAIYDPQQHHAHALHYAGHDPGTCCREIASKALWLLGYPDQALKRSQEAISLGKELSHPYSLAHALYSDAVLHLFRREAQVVAEQVAATITIATENDIPQQLAHGTMLQGWALAELGDVEQGIARMREGIAEWTAMGMVMQRPFYLALLAQAYWRAGQVDNGLMSLSKALMVAHASGERHFEAEIHRLRGELLLAAGQPAAQAESAYHQALQVARQQGTRSLELRAAMSLSRLWQTQAKHAEARQMLAEIYSWFTEGFDTPDLQDARALLEQL